MKKSAPQEKRIILKVKVNGVEKRYKPSRHYVFILQVRWSDLSEYVIYRKYSDFYTLQCGLVDKFPIEAGAIRDTDRTLPYLPGRLLFSRTEVSKVANQRRLELAKYCSSLLELNAKISQGQDVLDFFEATFEDINPPKDVTKKPARSRLLLALLPFLKKKNKKSGDDEDMTISGPIMLETYVAVTDYEATDKSEVTLVEGDHVEVFEKNSNGWWFVQNEAGKQGWAPASYLDPVSHPMEIDEPDPTYKGNLEKFITTEAYTAQFSDEITFEKDVIVEVMHKLLDGWWIISYHGDAGYAPAAYLEPYNNPHFLRSSTVKRQTIKPIPRRCTLKSKSKSRKKGTERDLSVYRKYSKKRKTITPAKAEKVPPKPPRIIEEEEEPEPEPPIYVNTHDIPNAIKGKVETVLEEEEPSYLEMEEDINAVYENITEADIAEARAAPVTPPRPGNDTLDEPSAAPCPVRIPSINEDTNCHSIPDIEHLDIKSHDDVKILSQLKELSVVREIEDKVKANHPPPPPFVPVCFNNINNNSKPLHDNKEIQNVDQQNVSQSSGSSGYESERNEKLANTLNITRL